MDQPIDPHFNIQRPEPLMAPSSDLETSPASPKAQANVDQLLAHVNEKIELLAFDEPNPALLRRMVQSLVDPRRATRISLVDALSEIGEPAIPYLLEGLTHHIEPVVRRACCNALMNIGDDTAVSALVHALQADDDISVKSAAAGALAKIGAPAFESIRGVLASDAASESAKGHAAWAMATMSSEVNERLYRHMSDPSPSVRMAVVGAIAQLAQKQMATQAAAQANKKGQTSSSPTPRKNESARNTLSLLTEALSDASSDVRIEAAAHLARLNAQRAYQPLVACLKDPDWEVRKAATLALGKLGNTDAIEAIASLANDTEAAVRRVATLVTDQLIAQRTKAS